MYAYMCWSLGGHDGDGGGDKREREREGETECGLSHRSMRGRTCMV